LAIPSSSLSGGVLALADAGKFFPRGFDWALVLGTFHGVFSVHTLSPGGGIPLVEASAKPELVFSDPLVFEAEDILRFPAFGIGSFVILAVGCIGTFWAFLTDSEASVISVSTFRLVLVSS